MGAARGRLRTFAPQVDAAAPARSRSLIVLGATIVYTVFLAVSFTKAPPTTT